MRSAAIVSTAALRTGSGAGVDGCPAERSMTDSPAARRLLTASITRMTWKAGTPPRALTRWLMFMLGPRRQPMPSYVDRSTDAPVRAVGAVEQSLVNEIAAHGRDVSRPHLTQREVHVHLLVAPPRLEQLRDVLQHDAALATRPRHRQQQVVGEERPQHFGHLGGIGRRAGHLPTVTCCAWRTIRRATPVTSTWQ